jgi:hypothetical protein
MKTRVMFIQAHGGLGSRSGRIGRVSFSKTGRTIYYGGLELQTLSGRGFKANYFNVETGIEYWVSGPKKDGNDVLYKGTIYIDDDVNEEYWTVIRSRPDMVGTVSFRSLGIHSQSGRRDKRPKGILSPRAKKA